MMVSVSPMQRLKAMLEGLGNGVKMEESHHVGVGAISGGGSEETEANLPLDGWNSYCLRSPSFSTSHPASVDSKFPSPFIL